MRISMPGAQTLRGRLMVGLGADLALLPSMITTTHSFVTHVAAHSGLPPDAADRVARMVISGIGTYLPAAHAQLAADELPPELGAALIAGDGLAVPIEERIVALGQTVGRARELIASVCRVLAEQLSIEAIAAIRRALPPDLAALVVSPALEHHEISAEPAATTLATGRPGSRHPISDSARSARQPESITSDNPHADTKLSSSSGTTQERHHETLADGRPGSSRPLSGRDRTR
jgi:uncharacterized protein (DUF2267 family)